ncbi:cbb3-type cytochrome c oxidase subunit 3 [Tabrizicola piscis]|jgi:cytochrome c oxidase cbb3-type subunit IV|uniref:Cbb3-type cytochrome c oxidase subunit 3 n=1 Tax=Tabrizicola piscis TaxID=2494374 RepID=A0A3S8U5K6_9RHOB|nr:cbb3-type cytochrome c oxidase subunit 3 [Tabrizicola piscis]AZL58906.1 cbb3-type cytochrome c oxidase subunit 3 [Tabrizicola piscis]
METYSFLRHMADSWFLLAMTLGFLGLCVWAFRPGSRAMHQDVANSIFRNDDRPADANSAPSKPAKKEG